MTVLFSFFSAQAQEIVREGIYDGRNRSALIFKDCSLEIFRGEDGILNVAGVRDEGNSYNLWSRDGSDFRLDTRSGIKTLGRQLRLSMTDAGGTKIYDSRTDKNDAQAYHDYGTLDVVTNSAGVPTLYKFVHGRSNNGAAPYRTVGIIQCDNLQAR